MPTHAEKRLVHFSPQQLFDLVADVGHYPDFLPWCSGARVRSHQENELLADLTIGFGPFRETFTSRVTLEKPTFIRVKYEQGPFRYLNNTWNFIEDSHGTYVNFFVDFEFRSRILQAAIGVVFNEAVKLMVSAFIRRAEEVYAKPISGGI
ncbi:type II toxin-antitoxin system RatA family toxin [Entomobacter blattae]|uniref:Persistence and stress-resistance toxin PasT n=1 Tax=Entomobacter blattae TaxID=2762277 RepID=A0A7H1NSG1_9PROT|nr:type II toxin-antitoxin system RatA family toxin [Entomobacter blattae]QNT78721.1 Persistence and stress-resistance toxin PasT [Entomobacter blattae]